MLAGCKWELWMIKGRWKENKGSSRVQSLCVSGAKPWGRAAWGHSRSLAEGPVGAEFGNAAGSVWKSWAWRQRVESAGGWAQSIRRAALLGIPGASVLSSPLSPSSCSQGWDQTHRRVSMGGEEGEVCGQAQLAPMPGGMVRGVHGAAGSVLWCSATGAHGLLSGLPFHGLNHTGGR